MQVHLKGLFIKRFNFCRKLSQLTSDKSLLKYGTHLQLFNDVISEEEEYRIIAYLNPVLARKRYEGELHVIIITNASSHGDIFKGNHWDDVIAKYKEIELSSNYKVPFEIESIFRRIEGQIEVALKRDKIHFMSPHVIDLARDGHIGEHKEFTKQL
jgi:hypothetical protein